VRIQDQVATVRLEEEFYNPNGRACEGTFLFPVPRGAHLDRFALTINGKPMEAELLAGDKARQIYEDIVRRSLDPALLEYVGRDVYKVRIFPIEPRATRQIALSYTQLLSDDTGLTSWTLPLRMESSQAQQSARSVSVRVELESAKALRSVYSPSHKVAIQRRGDRQATVTLESSASSGPDADLQLLFSRAQDDLGIDLMVHRPSADEEGYFLLMASPRIETAPGAEVAKDVVSVLDSSGSMAGAKLEQAKRALRFCVENLNEHDRFDVLRFSTEVEPLFQRLQEATRDRRDEARRFIDRIRPTGGTAIHEALQQALASRDASSTRSFVVVFLTDGRPTVGITDERQISDLVKGKGTGSLTRVFCFGIGTDVNTHLLDEITESTRAASTYVLADEDIEVKVSSFFSRIREPALVDLDLVAPEGVRLTRLHPHPLPDLFKGQQLLVAGRYSGHTTGRLVIRGRIDGKTREFGRPVVFAERQEGNEFLPRLWATRRVGHLLDEIRLRGENPELRDEVVELARRYAIVTPYTAYLVTEDETRRGIALERQTFQWRPEARAQARAELQDNYRALTRNTSGDLAVAGARAFEALKGASTPSDAIASGNAENLRAAPLAPASTAPPSPGKARASRATSAISSMTAAAPLAAVGGAFSGQGSRYASGKSFYQNGTQWVDAAAQSLTNTTARRIAFASDEYFSMLRRHPEARPWLALGSDLRLVIGGELVEIVPVP
jgi:Ca-activated chloride channel family protein